MIRSSAAGSAGFDGGTGFGAGSGGFVLATLGAARRPSWPSMIAATFGVAKAGPPRRSAVFVDAVGPLAIRVVGAVFAAGRAPGTCALGRVSVCAGVRGVGVRAGLTASVAAVDLGVGKWLGSARGGA